LKQVDKNWGAGRKRSPANDAEDPKPEIPTNSLRGPREPTQSTINQSKERQGAPKSIVTPIPIREVDCLKRG